MTAAARRVASIKPAMPLKCVRTWRRFDRVSRAEGAAFSTRVQPSLAFDDGAKLFEVLHGPLLADPSGERAGQDEGRVRQFAFSALRGEGTRPW